MNEVQSTYLISYYATSLKAAIEELNEKNKEIDELRAQLKYERELRREAELRTYAVVPVQEKKTRKQREVTQENKTYCDFKSDGKRKPHPADSIRSYDDFKLVQEYFLKNNNIRDWTLWTIGVSLGLRISDLLALKFENVIEDDKKTFCKRIRVYEQKTGKLQNCLITEAVTYALKKYIDSLNWKFELKDYLFQSKKTKGKMYEEYGWKIISDAGKAVKLPITMGSHTMRKSFANIAACVDKTCVDMNSITKVQGLLNHSDQKSTLKYLGSYQAMFDNARVAVSDFVLGKTNVNEIVAGDQYTIEDVFNKIETIENLLKEKGE